MPLTRPRTALLSDVDGYLNYTGMIKPHAATSAPSAGWLLCDGASYLRATYASLFALIGTTFGSVDGTHFNVPDMRGRTAMGLGQGAYSQSFLNTAVTAASDLITITANEHFVTGQKVQFTTTGSLPGGITAATNYFVNSATVGGTTFGISTSLVNAQNAVLIDITTQGTGTHTVVFQNFTSRTLGGVGGEEAHAMSLTELVAHTHTANVFTTTSGAGFGGFTTASLGTATSNSTGNNAAMNNLQPFMALAWIIKT